MSSTAGFFASFSERLFELWEIKLGFGIAITAFAAFFGIDERLVWLLVGAIVADNIAGVLAALKRGRFRCSVFAKKVQKIPALCVYILLVAISNLALEISFEMPCPFLELFLAYLVANESISIAVHMRQLGFTPPALVENFLLRTRKTVEEKAHKIAHEENKKIQEETDEDTTN